MTNLDEVSGQGSYTIGPSKFHDFSMTIFTKIHDLEKQETMKRAEQKFLRNSLKTDFLIKLLKKEY